MVKRVAFRTGNAVQFGDMVDINGTPHLVWEWRGDRPAVTTALAPEFLQTDSAQLPPGCDAVYLRDVSDPRKLQ